MPARKPPDPADAAEIAVMSCRALVRCVLASLSLEEQAKVLSRLDRADADQEPGSPGPRLQVLIDLRAAQWTTTVRVAGRSPCSVAVFDGMTEVAPAKEAA